MDQVNGEVTALMWRSRLQNLFRTNLSKLLIMESHQNTNNLDLFSLVLEKFESLVESPLEQLNEILGIVQIYKGIRDYLLAEKIKLFLYELNSISVNERNKFFKELDSAKKKRIFSQLILVLDKHDQFKKSEVQGKLFKAFIKGFVTFSEYSHLSYAINSMNIDNLKALASYYCSVSSINATDILQHFISLQLVSIDYSLIGTYGGGGPQFKRNRYGILLVELCSDSKIPDDYIENALGKLSANRLIEYRKFK